MKKTSLLILGFIGIATLASMGNDESNFKADSINLPKAGTKALVDKAPEQTAEELVGEIIEEVIKEVVIEPKIAPVKTFVPTPPPEPVKTIMPEPEPFVPPPPPEPVKTITPAPVQPSSSCDPNYSGCVPIASDVDCAGGTGNGPAYVSGPVRVIGSDIYGLDRNKDGWGCE